MSSSKDNWQKLEPICNLNWCLYFGQWPTKLKCKSLSWGSTGWLRKGWDSNFPILWQIYALFVPCCYAFVQDCNVKKIQYIKMPSRNLSEYWTTLTLLYISDTTNSVHRTLLQWRGLIQGYTECTDKRWPKKFHKEHDFKRDLAKQYRKNIIERVRFQNTAIILERLLVETNLALK